MGVSRLAYLFESACEEAKSQKHLIYCEACCSAAVPEIDGDIDPDAQNQSDNGDPNRVGLRFEIACAISELHKERVADAAAADESENKERGMDLAVVSLWSRPAAIALRTALNSRT